MLFWWLRPKLTVKQIFSISLSMKELPKFSILIEFLFLAEYLKDWPYMLENAIRFDDKDFSVL